MVVFSIFFGRLAQISSEGVPYSLFSLAGARAVDVLLHRTATRLGQPRQQRAARLEDLLPADLHPGRGCRSGARRPGIAFVILIVLVLACGRSALSLDAARGPAARRWSWSRPRSVSRPRSRRSTCATATCATSCRSRRSSGCSPHRSPIRARSLARAVAHALRAQPDGRRRRRVPLGASSERRLRPGRMMPSRPRRPPCCSSSGSRTSAASSAVRGHGLTYERRRDRDLRARQALHARRAPPRLRHAARGDRRERASLACGASPGAARPQVDATFWALRDVVVTIEPGRGRRPHRPQRRGQEHLPEDPLADHRADRGLGRRDRAASARCSRSAPGSTRS